jgi:hypothetical protein
LLMFLIVFSCLIFEAIDRKLHHLCVPRSPRWLLFLWVFSVLAEVPLLIGSRHSYFQGLLPRMFS